MQYVNKYTVSIALCMLCFYLGYRESSRSTLIEEGQELIAANELRAELQSKLYDAQAEIFRLEQQKDTEQQVITQEVIKYVESPNSSVCELDDAWVQLYQRSITNANAR